MKAIIMVVEKTQKGSMSNESRIRTTIDDISQKFYWMKVYHDGGYR